MKTLVLLSGGLDSFIASALATENSEEVYGLTFNYQQVNIKELEYAKDIANYFKFKDHIIMDLDFGAWRDKYLKTSLVRNSAGGKSTYVPARNLIFLSYAVGIADSMGLNAIAIGVTAADYSVSGLNRQGYPDCQPEFLKALQDVIDQISSKPIQIFAPIINATKDKMIEYGILKNLDFSKTWSCYTNQVQPCGECLACKNRIMGFYMAGVKDPLDYGRDFFELGESIKKEWQI
ncbi:MAG: 7-cyano-7-deazaguanine synthase [Halanaerobiales bacterium]|nr:7-cyano-7-deazaguanine synthase [Halanaerobiales bacterium]